MSPAIFVEKNGVLTAMTDAAYAHEDDLQTLLEQYPQLLLGDDGDSHHRYLLVEREAGVPDGDAAADRWSIDHLFLDSEGVPTFVEVKRRKDTRIRREVVGQLLEYAANARRYWPVDRLQADFARTTTNAESVLQEFLGAEVLVEGFWRDVQTNLEAGRIRLVFVADEIPEELKTIVEFLNEQMTQTEVLAIEVRRYAGGDGLTTLVSSIIGNTAKARDAKRPGGSARYSWTQPEVLDAIEAKFTRATRIAVENVLKWAGVHGFQIRQGSGATGVCMLVVPERDRALFTLSADGSIVFDHVRHYLRHAPFNDEPKRSELIERLDSIEPGGHAIRDRNRVSGHALEITLNDLAKSEVEDRFKNVLDWVIQQTSGNPSRV